LGLTDRRPPRPPKLPGSGYIGQGEALAGEILADCQAQPRSADATFRGFPGNGCIGHVEALGARIVVESCRGPHILAR
jgi:hypothetical protein